MSVWGIVVLCAPLAIANSILVYELDWALEDQRRSLVSRNGGFMAWLLILVAGVFETAWAVGLKYSDGFSRLVPSVLTVVAMAASFLCLAMALKSLPVGTAYAVWTGIGAAGTAVLGIYLFQEPATVLRLGSIALIVAGIAGLKLA